MEQIAVFQDKVVISPIDLHSDVGSFDEIILAKLKKQLEGKCSKHGFVIPGSLEMLSRSMGICEKGRATADFIYFVKAQGKVYNPPDGTEVVGEVSLKNKMGCYVVVDDAVRIMVPRDLHIGNDVFDGISVGDRIRVQIKKSQVRVNATHILSIGELVGVDSAAAPAAEAAEAPAEEAVEEAVEEVAQEELLEEDSEGAEAEEASEDELPALGEPQE
jgi:DNA-directed RNA polymerase subunit E'/Rpb7